MTIESQISLIMDLIGPEHLELFALDLKKLVYFTLFTLKHLQISTSQHQFGQNVYDHMISDEFDFGSNQTRTTRVICPELKRNCYI